MYYRDTYELAIAMFDDGMSPMEVAEALHIDFQTSLDILQDFERQMAAYG